MPNKQEVIPASDITNQDWYVALVEECQAIVTEGVFTSRWATVEMYHHLGERLVTDEKFQKASKGNLSSLTRLAKNIRVGLRDVYRAIQFYEKYPDISLLPDGKNISWSKVRKLLPAPKPETLPLPAGEYGVIYADPPWKYEEHGVSEDRSYGGTDKHYPSMTVEELCALPVGKLAADDCALFLWVTSPKLNQVWPIIEAWGFEYKTSFVWDKVKHNFGYYNSVRHEFLLICGRGKSTPEVSKLFDSVQTVERSDKHSEKPAEFRQIIETLYPSAAKIELFARAQHDGWAGWGDEAV